MLQVFFLIRASVCLWSAAKEVEVEVSLLNGLMVNVLKFIPVSVKNLSRIIAS